jgi:hypothetical protein
MFYDKFGDHLSMFGNDDRLPLFVNTIDQVKAIGLKLGDSHGHK